MDKIETKLKGDHKMCRNNIRAIHDAFDVIGGKWKISIISCLSFNAMRFSELLKEVEGISGKMLSRELKELETNQLINREVLSTHPITVRYTLTDYGKTVQPLTQTIAKWGLNHRKKIIG
ncbi:HxlR family transcriptional regulator [Galbibacter marinus]|uniref:HxlR family transcriptional regulator n=1 Tax=Galbibacter marinus TaxID=555500 RepID=K2PS61_9FLAO|nr:helix-turn-helix domain-containing protein [Galbibacter marinus]EKF54339.1 HxlR family transcriptional regulator [Galbibacter marinus]